MSIGPEITGVMAIIVLIVLLLSRMWIGIAMALVGFLGFASLTGLGPGLKLLATVPYTTLFAHNMSPIPLFIFMGVVVGSMGIGEDLYKVANVWIGQFRGGLTQATTLACAALAAISGSSVPALVTMGKVAIPEMEKYNYNIPVAAASIASAGTLGILIPPSTGFILYSILTNQSVAKLFIAGILPGVLLALLLMVVIAIIYRLNPGLAPRGQKTNIKQKIVSLKLVWPMLLLFLLVIGGMYGGIFTATEGGAIGAFGSVVISAVKKRLTPQSFIDSLLDAVKITGMIAILIAGGFLLMRFIALSKLPFAVTGFVQDLNMNRYVIFALIIVMYIILGMFLDIYGAVVLTVPIIYPIITAFGFDPIWFGVIVVMVIEMGLVTPPIGINVFTLSGITGIPTEQIFSSIAPMVAMMIICVIILTIFPGIVLFLPNMM